MGILGALTLLVASSAGSPSFFFGAPSSTSSAGFSSPLALPSFAFSLHLLINFWGLTGHSFLRHPA